MQSNKFSSLEKNSYIPGWAKQAVFYHIYPLGFFAAPQFSNEETGVCNRLSNIREYYQYFKDLGITVIQFGPVFQSSSHGYDTTDYRLIDKRLGTNELFRDIVNELHSMGIKVILDGVFNHVSRDFFSFTDIIKNRLNSNKVDWHFIDFSRKNSTFHDGFDYQSWEGYHSLVKINLSNREVREYIFDSVRYWMNEIGIDGWRLDVAYQIGTEFWSEFRTVCRSCKSDCLLIGEMIHGPYKRLLGENLLDAATGYQIYKSIWSSFNSKNMYELKNVLEQAYNSTYGMDANSYLMHFLGNHDTTRIRSILSDERYIIPAYLLLFTLNGFPKIYYGDELGMTGIKTVDSDLQVRQQMRSINENLTEPVISIFENIKRFITMRKQSHALMYGDIVPVFADNVNCNIIGFLRKSSKQTLLIIVNGSDSMLEKSIPLWGQNLEGARFIDILNDCISPLIVTNNQLMIPVIYPYWGSVLELID
jgi:glycosidase